MNNSYSKKIYIFIIERKRKYQFGHFCQYIYVKNDYFQYYLFLSDIGSILGLWIGISALTIGEYMELFVDAIVLSVAKIIGASRRRKTETEVTQIRVTQACEKDDNYDIIAIKTSILRNSNRRLDLHRPSIRNSGKGIPEKDNIKFPKINSKNKQKHIHKSKLGIPIE